MLAESYRNAEVLETYERNNKRYARIRCKCGRCGGTGLISWSRLDNGVCWECRGAKTFIKDVRDYSDAEIQSIERAKERRREKAAKAFEEKKRKANAITTQRYGFNGMKAYVVLGDTYSIKDELKEHGAKYSPELKWVCPTEPTWLSGYDYAEINLCDIFKYDDYGWLVVKDDASNIIEALQPKTGEYVGTVGSKIKVTVTVTNVFENALYLYGHSRYTYKHIMKSDDGNVFVWNTSTACYNVGHTMTLVGTVKAHEEYRGVRQTILTRCKEVQ